MGLGDWVRASCCCLKWFFGFFGVGMWFWRRMRVLRKVNGGGGGEFKFRFRFKFRMVELWLWMDCKYTSFRFWCWGLSIFAVGVWVFRKISSISCWCWCWCYFLFFGSLLCYLGIENLITQKLHLNSKSNGRNLSFLVLFGLPFLSFIWNLCSSYVLQFYEKKLFWIQFFLCFVFVFVLFNGNGLGAYRPLTF